MERPYTYKLRVEESNYYNKKIANAKRSRRMRISLFNGIKSIITTNVWTNKNWQITKILSTIFAQYNYFE